MIGNPTRVGDLAVLINVEPVNLGVFVEVVSVDGEVRQIKARSAVLAKRKSSLFWVVKRTSRVTVGPGVCVWVNDRALQPIRPSAPPESVIEPAEREATA